MPPARPILRSAELTGSAEGRGHGHHGADGEAHTVGAELHTVLHVNLVSLGRWAPVARFDPVIDRLGWTLTGGGRFKAPAALPIRKTCYCR